jgi:transcription initiation factor IIE alpha subunit
MTATGDEIERWTTAMVEPRYFQCPSCDTMIGPCVACGQYPRRCEECGKSLRETVRAVERGLREWRREAS